MANPVSRQNDPKGKLPASLTPLIELPHWVIWMWQPSKQGKRTKVPFQPRDPQRKAETNDPSTWTTYEEALAAAKYGDGIGFVLSNTEFVAFDIDNCRNAKTGKIHAWAMALVAQAGSYTEVTVSGTGVRIIGRGNGAPLHRKLKVVDGVSCEIYRRATRYIVMTGNQIGDNPINNIDAVMDATLAELDGERPGSAEDGGHHARHKDLDDVIQNGCYELFKNDKSRAVWFVINEGIRQGWSDDKIAATLLDKENEISKHNYEAHPEKPEKYVRKQIADARKEQEKRRRFEYELVRASDVVIRPKEWIWRGHLLRGSMELMTGVPGIGKSQVQLSYVAHLTTGDYPWPDGTPATKPANVIMVTIEDSLDQEIVPRLIAAGANLERVSFLRRIKRDKLKRLFLLSEDLEVLEQIIKDVGNVGLVCIDPITAFMGKVDSHRATDVRGQLGPLADFAERINVAVSVITHPAKVPSQRAIDQFIGSQAFIAAGRIGHLCVEEIEREDGKPVRDEEGQVVKTGRNLFTVAKINVGEVAQTLAYKIDKMMVGPEQNIETPYAVWDMTPVGLTADQALTSANGGGNGKGRDKGVDVKMFLELMLANGPVAVAKIEEQAARRGVSMDQLKRMKKKLHIEGQPEGFGEKWVWWLPKDRAPDLF